MGIMRTKSIEQSIRDTEDPEFKLKEGVRSPGPDPFRHRRDHRDGALRPYWGGGGRVRGPAVALSYVVAGVACSLAALCYAEFASTVPVAGSAYTFSYASLGEFVAWLIGWDLILEFTLGAATVAKGWSGYLVAFWSSSG